MCVSICFIFLFICPCSVLCEFRVCKTADIRNTVREYAASECQVIEGFVSLVRIRDFKNSNFSFPKLLMITHFLFIYRIDHLKSLSELFPRLTSIGGQVLIKGAALVIYQNYHLENIGLNSLLTIRRGDVRIVDNIRLCYIHTVHWGSLLANGHLRVRSRSDKQVCSMQLCSDRCPVHADTGSSHCWSHSTCQLSERHVNHGCHHECLGGCTVSNSSTSCRLCRNLLTLPLNCVDKCPENTCLYSGWRCLSHPYMQFKNLTNGCDFECSSAPSPDNELLDFDRHSECQTNCSKRILTVINDVKRMKHCLVVQGDLIIKISNDSLTKQLHKYLGNLRVITGSLQIMYTTLTSLDFLSSLREIRGENSDHSLVVMENVHLYSLWSTSSQLTLVRGPVLIHLNKRLCFNVIDAFLRRVNVTYVPDVDVSRYTNGDQLICGDDKILLNVTEVDHRSVKITFSNYKLQVREPRLMLGYTVYYKETTSRNISVFDGYFVCHNNPWKTQIVIGPQNGVTLDYTLSGLKPHTMYAIVVKALIAFSLNISQEAKSNMVYFMTLAAEPDRIRDFGIKSVGRDYARFEWSRPEHANGVLDRYYLLVVKFSRHLALNSTEICHSLTNGTIMNKFRHLITNEGPTRENMCCVCDNQSRDTSGGADMYSGVDELYSVRKDSFQTYLSETSDHYSFVDELIKHYTSSQWKTQKKRVKRHIEGENFEYTIFSDIFEIQYMKNCSANLSKSADMCVHSLSQIAAGDVTKWRVSNLDYSSHYVVHVRACNVQLSPHGHPLCGESASMDFVTSPLDAADRVTGGIEILPNKLTTSVGRGVDVVWTEPQKPNGGGVQAYEVHVNPTNEAHATSMPYLLCPLKPCTNTTCLRSLSVTLPFGNISVRIRAFTIAGFGPFSDPRYVYIQSPSISIVYIGLILGMSVAAFLCIILLVYCLTRRHTIKQLDFIYSSWNPYYDAMSKTVYVADEWEVDIADLSIEACIGRGQFGSVYAGRVTIRHPPFPALSSGCEDAGQRESASCQYYCAVKTLLPHSTDFGRNDFLSEASIMKKFNCSHIVRLLGIVSDFKAECRATTADCDIPRPPYVIMELMEQGDLKKYLLQRRNTMHCNDYCDSQMPVICEIYEMGAQIADGMAYLHSMNIVHRDLAARNCLVSANMVIKIGDFGMTRHLYEKDYYKKVGCSHLPVRWMPPESLRDGTFTSSTDVWSFGVVLWEISTLASYPYPGHSNYEVVCRQLDGRLSLYPPASCPPLVSDLMRLCFSRRPSARPAFADIVHRLSAYTGEHFRACSYVLTALGETVLPPPAPPPPATTEKEPSQLEAGVCEDSPLLRLCVSETGSHLSGECLPYSPSPATSSSAHARAPPLCKSADSCNGHIRMSTLQSAHAM